MIIIHMVSYDLTQKIQKSWGISFSSEHLYVRFGGVIILMTIIVSICLTGAARSINSDIAMTTEISGLVLTLLGGLLLCV